MTAACGLPWLINGRASFLGNGFVSLMLAYYWTSVLWKVQLSFSLSLSKSPGTSSSEFVENINHISLDSFSKPAWDNNEFRVLLWAGRHICFILRRWIALRKFGFTNEDTKNSCFFTPAAQESHFRFILLFLLFHFVLAAVMCRFPVAQSRQLLEEIQARKDTPSPPFEPDSIFYSLQRSHELMQRSQTCSSTVLSLISVLDLYVWLVVAILHCALQKVLFVSDYKHTDKDPLLRHSFL